MFEWDEAKREANLAKHGFDFEDVVAFFDSDDIITVASIRGGEQRWKSIGRLEGRFVTVIWTWRGDVRRIISLRRARDEEKRAYRSAFR